MSGPVSKSERDRLRGRARGNKAKLDSVRNVLREYRQGRAASACMADIERALGAGGKTIIGTVLK